MEFINYNLVSESQINIAAFSNTNSVLFSNMVLELIMLSFFIAQFNLLLVKIVDVFKLKSTSSFSL